MDNFYFLDVKPTIERSEMASIKDAIFRRAREKSNSLASEKNEGYTSDIQNDVMLIARESIQKGIQDSSMNPFNQFKDNIGIIENKNETAQNIFNESGQPNTNAPEKGVKEVKRNIESANLDTFTNSVKNEAMRDARNQFNRNTNLTLTLNFLNTQAAIQMAKNAHSKINYT